MEELRTFEMALIAEICRFIEVCTNDVVDFEVCASKVIDYLNNNEDKRAILRNLIYKAC